MRSEAVRLAGRCLGVTAAASLSAAAGAQQAQTALYLSTGVSAESNPYNAANSDFAVAATAEVQPVARFRTETTVLDVRGLAQFRQFFRRYGLEDNYAINADLSSRVSDRLTLRSSGAFSYNEGGYNNFGRPGLSPIIGTITPSTPLPTDSALPNPTLPNPSLTDLSPTDRLPLLTDVTILGQRTRTTTIAGGAGFDARIAEHSHLSGDLSVRAQRFKAFSFNDYNTASAELRGSHDVNEFSSVGLIGSVERVDYLASRVGDTISETALVSYDRRFSQGWALSLAVGASFSSINQPAGLPNAHITALSLRGRFCKQGERSQFCVSGQRSPQPSANGAVRVSNSVEADYSRRLSERERVSFIGSYARTGRGQGVADVQPAIDFASASARYDNQLGERLSLFASASFAKVFSSVASRRANLGVAAGVQFRLGALK